MKKLVITSIVLAVALIARADVLYWMVDDTYAETASGSADYAFLRVNDSADNMSSVYTLATKTGAQVYNAYDFGDQFATDISAYSSDSYYFYVELANGLRTEAVNYANLGGALYKGGISMPSSVATAFGQGKTYNVPEPTSGLLFLVGGMLLGLKRRRQKV